MVDEKYSYGFDDRQHSNVGRYFNSISMLMSRFDSSEAINRCTRSFDAGATFWLETTPKPLGVSTRSSDGTAFISAWHTMMLLKL